MCANITRSNSVGSVSLPLLEFLFLYCFFSGKERAAFDKNVYGEKCGHDHDLVYILGLLRRIP